MNISGLSLVGFSLLGLKQPIGTIRSGTSAGVRSVHKSVRKIIVVCALLFVVSLNLFAQANELVALQKSTRNVASVILPSVVTIDTTSTVKVPVRQFGFFFDPFDNNKQDDKKDAPSREYSQEGLGSGILVRKDKNTYYVLTNAHVVQDVDKVSIITVEENTFDAEIVGIDSGRDLAMVSFESEEDFPIASLGDSDSLQQGDIVFAVGNPYGFRSSITFGIVSALDREATPNRSGFSLTNYIQTDAAVNRGNSGGPLVNINGEVIGINTWIYSAGGGGNEGLSFAVPINNAKLAINDFIEKGEVDYGWLGARIEKIFDEEMHSLGTSDGVLIGGVYSLSPAERSGLKPGDVVQKVNGATVKNERDLINKITGIAPGEKAVLGVWRDGKNIEVSVTLAKRLPVEKITDSSIWPGFSIIDITDSLKDRLELSSNSGVVVTNIDQKSAAATGGLQSGDVIERINNKRVRNIREFFDELDNVKKNEEAIFRLTRGKTSLVIGIVKD